MTMSPFRLSVVIFFCVSVTWALPKRPFSSGASSGAGEIPDEFPQDNRPFDGPLGKGSSSKEVFNDYDLDSDGGPQIFPEDYENEIHPHPKPQAGDSERPLKPDDRIPEEKHPEDERKEQPEEEEDHEPASHEKPKGGEETHDDDEEETTGGEGEETTGGEGEETTGGEGEDEDTHAVEDEEKPHEDEEEETQEGEEKLPLPFNTALFSFQQVNHYIKQLEKAMENVFKDSLEEPSLLNNTYVNTTEEEVEMDGHKYKVQKSLIETGDEDKNTTLFVEAISSVNEDEPKNRSQRSNPDSEPIQ